MASLQDKNSKTLLYFLLLIWGTAFGILFWNCIEFRPDGLYAGHPFLWSDWALHIGQIQIFSLKPFEHWFTYHHMFADGAMTYPFLANLVSTAFYKVGFDLKWALFLSSWFTALFLVAGLYYVGEKITGSKLAATLGVFLFLLSGGPNFLPYLNGIRDGNGIDWLLQNDFTAIKNKDWLSGNVIAAILYPQRAFLLGMTLGLWSLYFFLKNGKRSSQIVSGILLGLMPITHAHTMMVLLPIFGLLVLHQILKKQIPWWFIITAGILGPLLYFLFLYGKIPNPNFMTFEPWWTSQNFVEWAVFWLKAWGPVLPLFCYFLASVKMTRDVKLIAAGFVFIFLFSNLVKTQPLNWDNSKLFYWCYWFFSLCVAWLLIEFHKRWRPLFVYFLVLIMCGAGTFEVFKLFQFSRQSNRMISTEEMRLYEKVRNETGDLDRFLTWPTHLHPVMFWAARPVLMGYSAWALNYGFDYYPMELDIQEMYRGSDKTEALLKKHRVRYVVIGPYEKSFPQLNTYYFDSHYKVRFEDETTKIYDLNP